LAGRTAFVELLPFSFGELTQAGKQLPNIDRMLYTGGYPPLYDRYAGAPCRLHRNINLLVQSK